MVSDFKTDASLPAATDVPLIDSHSASSEISAETQEVPLEEMIEEVAACTRAREVEKKCYYLDGRNIMCNQREGFTHRFNSNFS